MLLLSVDGKPISGMDVCAVNALLLQPRGATLMLLVKEGDAGPIEVKLTY